MTLDPMLPLWFLVPAIAVLVVLCGWRMLRERRTPLARDWAARLAMVLLLLVIALRPAVAGQAAGAEASGGLEVYFVVDTTSSMAADDFGTLRAPGITGETRLDGVKSDIPAIAASLEGAEFSLITFDSSAVQRMPLTTDVTALESSVSVMTQEVTAYSSGSSIDAGLDLVVNVLTEAKEQNPDRPRVLYYFGDGEQTAAGEPASFAAAAPFISGGAVLGYGTEAGGRMLAYGGLDSSDDPGYVQDYRTDPPTDAISSIDEKRLGTLAAQLGVQYLHRTSATPLAPATDGIDVGPSTSTSEPPVSGLELYWIAAVPVAALLLRELLLALAALRDVSQGTGRKR